MGDVAERKLWGKYMNAYEAAIRHTSRPEAPWYVVPADNKWFARLLIAEAMVEAMGALKLEFPKVEGAVLRELEKVRRALVAEKSRRT
jgi:polyphosphate kinase 2 PPK2